MVAIIVSTLTVPKAKIFDTIKNYFILIIILLYKRWFYFNIQYIKII